MKKLFFVICVFLLQYQAKGQLSAFEPIDKLGWEATNFSMPDKLTDTDLGEVNYLLTLTRKGKVKSIELLENTFTPETERLWRAMVRDLKFSRPAEKEKGKPHYRGTLLISWERCKKPVEIGPGSMNNY